ncbi:hypothetical protein LWF15_03725 [Kineosporia rhizophila]|uniref:calcium-binding protein n=1 Tax=Kineosporia TaxID=49184 RepID=UPI001E63E2E5|nr:hypothetical protein [Kineosporia sp. NBRC 101677]MCE0534608.1 hypothetical protein [Kineosporia rhizophila]GLY15602.1 hypothetical protein Kisp01_26170 [Kineosporia sp. NBRC 101677]
MLTQTALRRVLLPASALALGASAVLGPAAPALAGSAAQGQAEVENWYLHYTAAPGQANQLTVTTELADDGFYRYTIDDSQPIDAGEGCEYPAAADLTEVVCLVEGRESQDPYVMAKFRLGDQSDTVRFHNRTRQAYYSNEFWLGAGNDKADTRPQPGAIDGSGIWGQDGRDQITAGGIGDLGGVWGGNNNDTIRIGGGYNSAHGGNGDDKLYGDKRASFLRGDRGDDLLDGGAGADGLYGGEGNDVVYGRAGADELFGNSGNDRLYGGPGTDTISGGPGRDHIEHD